jgi:hypothetical protein
MRTEIETDNALDIELTEALTAESKSKSLLNKSLAAGSVLLAGLLGLAAVTWAGNQKLDMAALKAVMESLPAAKVAVKLEEGGTVRLADSGVVRLAEGSLPAMPQVTESKDKAIKTSVTVFRMITEANGNEVTTGWVFPSGAAAAPTSQYCYLALPADKTGAATRIELARNQVPTSTTAFPPDELARLRTKCNWFNGVL